MSTTTSVITAGGFVTAGNVKAATVTITGAATPVAGVAAGSALTLVAATHNGKKILLNAAAGSTVTLPTSTGSGAAFGFYITTTATSNNHKIQVANSTDIIQGLLFALSDDGAGGPVKGWEAGASDDTITLNRTTTGTAKVGHFIEIVDVSAGVFHVRGFIAQSGTEATPFSSAV